MATDPDEVLGRAAVSLATSGGMAMADQWLAARYNADGFPLFDFDVYALAGDGCMMEGISSETASLAGHQQLASLCWIAYGWNVTTVADANDLPSIARAFGVFRAENERPTLRSRSCTSSPTTPSGWARTALTRMRWPRPAGWSRPEYRDQVLPRSVRARVAIEQASTLGWDRYVGDGGAIVGMRTFGAPAPLKQLLTKFGFTPDRVADVARRRATSAAEEMLR